MEAYSKNNIVMLRVELKSNILLIACNGNSLVVFKENRLNGSEGFVKILRKILIAR